MQKFELGNIKLQCEVTLNDAVLAYETYGTLNQARTNVVVVNTSFGAQHYDFEWLIAPGKALDPDKYFIVIVNLFGNGLSTSPSNVKMPYREGRFPLVTMYDAVLQQRRLLDEVIQAESVELVVGYSMGGQQALHWAALYGDYVKRVAAICAAARTPEHCKVFIDSVRAVLLAEGTAQRRWFDQAPTEALRAVGRIFSAWALSQEFYRKSEYRKLGYCSREDFILNMWEKAYLAKDANNLLSMLNTWHAGDVSNNGMFGGNVESALNAITAKALIMPGATDCYFTVDDCRDDAAHIRDCRFLPIPSIWGHRGGNPNICAEDASFVDAALSALLGADSRS